ncbi:FtsX-like permease family protein [Candidatus Marithrix sp. Canyon 246]|uniref:FtsX-like permease family protein n=1 Tax=Candidatus Marithrix sp. Canyon 246 TaxID=1827136 RepID=UPI00084A0D8F|nr:FtsX-like permease family protein [Candidatus Marithrix sp. Canyon 246]
MTTTKKPKGLVATLAILDLRHEWILTLCMVLAIAAVLAPLLILLGLKYGTIETMRERLIEDPVNREIKPARTLQLSSTWFDDFSKRDDVAFIVPTILRGSSIVRIIKKAGDYGHALDLVPTAPNDPLILENGAIVPLAGECVLSYSASEELGIKTGDVVTARITRTRRGRREYVETPLKVIAILNPRADGLSRIYAPLQFVTDVELYREGQAVTARNWAGSQPRPFLSFDGAFVIHPARLSRIKMRMLTINTGLAQINKINSEQFQQAMGFALPSGYTIYKLAAKGNTIQTTNIKRLKNKLRGQSAIVLPFVENISLKLNQEIKIIGLSITTAEAKQLEIPALKWTKNSILLPDHIKFTSGKASALNGKIEFPITNIGKSFSKYAIVPIELIGSLKTGEKRNIIYDETQNSFLLARAGYRGFRLYARSIDDIPTLYRHFIENKIEVITKVQSIEKVKILDRGLTRIFWLVAIIGIIGGIAALIASLYAAVERKKRDIGILRLMGLSRNEVFIFPIYQGISIAIISVIVAIMGYASLSYIINFVFAADLRLGEKICFLPNEYFMIAFIATTIAAAMSSLLAAWKTTEIEPAEAIREE